MAARYALGLPCALAATLAPAMVFKAGANEAHIQEIWTASTVIETALPSFGIHRPTNTPVATGAVLGQAEDPAEAAATGSLATTWSTAPTVSGNPFQRTLNSGLGIGAQFSYHWSPSGPGLVVPANGWLVLWNYGTATLTGELITFVWEE